MQCVNNFERQPSINITLFRILHFTGHAHNGHTPNNAPQDILGLDIQKLDILYVTLTAHNTLLIQVKNHTRSDHMRDFSWAVIVVGRLLVLLLICFIP